MPSVTVASGQTEKLKLNPMRPLPGATFTFQNNLDIPVVISSEGKSVTLDKAQE